MVQYKDIICDSGVLISLTVGCLDGILNYFAEHHHVRFLIPASVEYECVTHPLRSNIKKYLFSALRIKKAMDSGIIVRVESDVTHKAEHLMSLANNLFFARAKALRLIDAGESEVMVLAAELGIEYVLIDERTTRVLIESPISMKDHLEKEFGVNIMVNKKNLRELSESISKLKLLRSSELVMMAYENGYFAHFRELQRDAMEAALYSMKHAGCSIGFDEINDYLSWVK